MPRLIADRIREVLQEHSGGLTIKQIAEVIGHKSPDMLRERLKSTWGVYIDHWEGPKRGKWQAVYCLADVPPDEPRPTKSGLRLPE